MGLGQTSPNLQENSRNTIDKLSARWRFRPVNRPDPLATTACLRPPQRVSGTVAQCVRGTSVNCNQAYLHLWVVYTMRESGRLQPGGSVSAGQGSSVCCSVAR